VDTVSREQNAVCAIWRSDSKANLCRLFLACVRSDGVRIIAMTTTTSDSTYPQLLIFLPTAPKAAAFFQHPLRTAMSRYLLVAEKSILESMPRMKTSFYLNGTLMATRRLPHRFYRPRIASAL
jgi:hypothetical protein